ncbi:MAG: GDSL-type esterase/lipase family protein [Pseudanabaenales cyanobacterium]|nr:GDSL-type esterase/lipase family protein [Pseudanabaenales cyanobacterium]
MSKCTQDIRVCFIGDSMVNGTGDPDCLGWVGRVGQAMRGQEWDLTVYNLGVRRETSLQIEQRWRREVTCRLPIECDRRLVFSFGVNDTTLEDDKLRVNAEESVACARRILGKAKQQYPVLMIGPPVIADTDHNQRIAQLSDQYAALCTELDVPYLAVYESLGRSSVWMQEAAAGDGAHPGAGGYTELAKLILDWSVWQAWFPQP